MKPIDLAGFEAKFAQSDDPWSTWDKPDEVVKRHAILHALGPGPLGRVLELGAGNGSNSRSLAARALRLDATEATAHGTRRRPRDRRPRPARPGPPARRARATAAPLL